MARKPAKMYRQVKGQSFTRREYTGGVPNNRILRYFMGNRKAAEAGDFPVVIELTSDNACQIRDTALEAARQVANSTIRNSAGADGYALRIHVYPHQILRENKQATGAGADRVSQGMRQAFGKNVGTAARVLRGQTIVSIHMNPENYDAAKEALRKASCKFPTPCSQKPGDPLAILQDSLRGAPIIWKGDYPYFIHPISDGIPRMDPSVLRAARDLIVSMVDWSEIDLIASVEAMGLPLLASVGEATGKPTVVIRKRSYGMEGEVKVEVSTGYSESTTYINDIRPGERLLIVDDVISTGGTLEPILDAIEGMGAKLQDIIIAIEKGDGRERLSIERPDWRIRTLARIEIIDGKVEIIE